MSVIDNQLDVCLKASTLRKFLDPVEQERRNSLACDFLLAALCKGFAYNLVHFFVRYFVSLRNRAAYENRAFKSQLALK